MTEQSTRRAARVFSPRVDTANRWVAWGIGLVAAPLALFIIVAVLLPRSTPGVVPIPTAQVWSEPLGNFAFNQTTLAEAIQRPPPPLTAAWRTVSLPLGIALDADIDLPDDAPKSRVWFRVSIPQRLLDNTPGAPARIGRIGLMGNRIMGGPWAVWVDGKLLQSNLADWRIGWNVPMRVMLPLDIAQPHDVLISVVYPDAKAYAMGSLFAGSAEAVDQAWHDRNLWHTGITVANGSIAAALMLFTLQLALARRQEPVYGLLCANALYWLVLGFQYSHDFTGNEALSSWFGWAVDASVNWVVSLGVLFALELERLAFPRLRIALIVYATLSTLATMPLWHWNKSALIAQHLVNVAVFVPCTLYLTWHALRQQTRSSWMLTLVFWVLVALGTHDLFYLSNQASPDHVHAFQASVIALFVVFVYLLNRRFLQSVVATERHEEALREQLATQARQLTEQHQALERLRVEAQLREQRDAIMQDLHDRVGSSLTTVLHRVRGGGISADEITLLLQELEDELRNMSRPTAGDAQTLNEILANLRQRIQRRLNHGAIDLVWNVDPYLPDTPLTPVTAMHLRALLNEAIANVIKHANATEIRVSAAASDTTVEVEIRDNGQGFEPQSVTGGRGLSGMKYRAKEIGAELAIHRGQHAGCHWQLTLPNAKDGKSV